MTTQAMLDFLLDQLQRELANGPGSTRETEIKAELVTAPEIARRAAARQPGWEVYDRALRAYVSRFADHPAYRAEWRLDPEDGKA